MKRLLRALLTAFLLAAALPVYAAAAEPAFSVAIRLDGQAETAVSAGDVVTVTVTLDRTDAADVPAGCNALKVAGAVHGRVFIAFGFSNHGYDPP